MDLNCRRHSGFSLLPLNSWEWVRSLGRSISSACSRTCGSDAAAALCSLISLSHHCAHKHPAPACTRSSSKTQLRLCILHFVPRCRNISHRYKEIILLLDFLATELAEVSPPSPLVKEHHKSMRLFCCLCRASWKGWSWSCPAPGQVSARGCPCPLSPRAARTARPGAGSPRTAAAEGHPGRLCRGAGRSWAGPRAAPSSGHTRRGCPASRGGAASAGPRPRLWARPRCQRKRKICYNSNPGKCFQ